MRHLQSDERSHIGVLDPDECRLLLRSEVIGRLAVGERGQAPIVVPVNFIVDGDTIVFRREDGPGLDRMREQPVSFEVDRFDLYRRMGWSVLVRGVAHEITAEDVAHLDLEPWAPGDKRHWVRIAPTAITGRRIELHNRPLDSRAYL